MESHTPTWVDLHAGLTRLRESWPHAWAGLPAVAADCLRQLGHRDDAQLSATARAIRDCIGRVAVAIEDDGVLRQQQGIEPPYHNRLHIADTLSSMVCLLQAARSEQQRAPDSAPSDTEWVLMLAMLAHDFQHTGKVNQFPGEIESHSVSALQPLMQAASVPDAVRDQIAGLILMTDPARVRAHHEAMRGRPFDLDDFDCMAMLLQECDILASAMPGHGIVLTHQLADEWSRISEPMAASLLSARSRIIFLRDFALFSSPASALLGLHAMKAAEIHALEGIAADTPI